MLKKFKVLVASLSVISFLFIGVSVFAYYASSTQSHDGKTINVSLNATLNPASATAKTTWAGITGHKVKTDILSCNDWGQPFSTESSVTTYSNATASFSRPDPQFEIVSEHFVIHNSTGAQLLVKYYSTYS